MLVLTAQHKVFVKGHQNNPQTPRILHVGRRGRTPGSEIPGSTLFEISLNVTHDSQLLCFVILNATSCTIINLLYTNVKCTHYRSINTFFEALYCYLVSPEIRQDRSVYQNNWQMLL